MDIHRKDLASSTGVQSSVVTPAAEPTMGGENKKWLFILRTLLTRAWCVVSAKEHSVPSILDSISNKCQGRRTAIVTNLNMVRVLNAREHADTAFFNIVGKTPLGKRARRLKRSMTLHRAAHNKNRKKQAKEKRKRTTTGDNKEGAGEKRPKLDPTLPKGTHPYRKRHASPSIGGPAKRSAAVQTDDTHHTTTTTIQNLEALTTTMGDQQQNA